GPSGPMLLLSAQTGKSKSFGPEGPPTRGWGLLAGELAAAFGGGGDGFVDEAAQVVGFEAFDRRLGGAAGRGDALAQGGGVLAGFAEHARGAQDRLQHQGAGGVGRQALGFAGGLRGFGEQEDVGRATARHGRDG